jgi:hypothetical protein
LCSRLILEADRTWVEPRFCALVKEKHTESDVVRTEKGLHGRWRRGECVLCVCAQKNVLAF